MTRIYASKKAGWLLLPLLIGPMWLGCADMDAEPYRLGEPRVLALRAATTTDDTLELEALTWKVAAPSWQACASPWVAAADPVCPGGAIPLGVGNPITIATPELSTIWVRVDGGELPAIANIPLESPSSGPELGGLTADAAPASGPLPLKATPGQSLEIRPLLESPEGVLTSYYASAGRFEPFRTNDGGSSTLTLPTEVGPVTIMVIARAGLGVSWRTAVLEVTP